MTTETETTETVAQALTNMFGDDYERMIDNVATIVDNYRTDYEPRLVFSSGYVGANSVYGYDDYVAVANYRALLESWSDFDVLTNTYSDIDTIGLRLSDPAPYDLAEIVSGLADYPVIDDQLMSEVEQETIIEHWESYGRSDLIAEIETVLGADVLTDYATEIIDQLVWSGVIDYGYGGGYPTTIDSSMCDFGIGKTWKDETGPIARWIANRIGRMSVTVPTSNGYDGTPLTIRFDRSAWVSIDK